MEHDGTTKPADLKVYIYNECISIGTSMNGFSAYLRKANIIAISWGNSQRLDKLKHIISMAQGFSKGLI